jgi:hypothetical protein
MYTGATVDPKNLSTGKALYMKKRFAVAPFLAGLLLIASCTRHTGSVNGCISRYNPNTGPLLRSGQLDTIDTYFQKNHLSTANLQFLYVNIFPAQQTATHHYDYQVGVGLILNGLRVPSANMVFDFDSTGALTDSLGGYSGQLPNNDTTGRQSLENLRQLFLANYKQCVIAGGAANSKPEIPTAPYDDTCLSAELVYVDAGIQNGSGFNGQQLVKAWIVTAADNSYFPEVTVIDNTGQAIPFKVFLP